MLFNTPEFAVFFVIVCGLYWLLRNNLRSQNTLILASSYLFYGWWDVRFLFLIALSTAVDYVSALMIDRGSLTRRERFTASGFLIGSAVLFLGIQLDAVDIWPPDRVLPLIDWANILSGSNGMMAVGATIAFVVAANLIYPLLLGAPEERRRKTFLFISIASNLLILGFFKYFNFFADSLSEISQILFGVTPSNWTLDIVLPVGISFYTFQTMSYTIDVYRRQLRATGQFIDFAAYVSFFPQLVAGPIERGKHLLPQFHTARTNINWEGFREGAWLIAWGLFKKLVVADNMAKIVNGNFAPYDTLAAGAGVPDDGLRLLFTVYAFALQIYGDFSGYTDIARGTARIMGFDIMLNFNLPYFATSPSSFWRRWHISLSTWLRDYLYIPLGGNRGGNLRTTRNLALTMILGGLWHGAAWNFVIWGAYHGALLGIYRVAGLRTESAKLAWWQSLALGLFMFQLTCIGWLIFRATNVATIGIFLEAIFLHPNPSPEAWAILRDIFRYSWFLILFQIVQGITNDLNPLRKAHWFIRLNVWIYVIMALLTLASTGGREFIYFAF